MRIGYNIGDALWMHKISGPLVSYKCRVCFKYKPSFNRVSNKDSYQHYDFPVHIKTYLIAFTCTGKKADRYDNNENNSQVNYSL